VKENSMKNASILGLALAVSMPAAYAADDSPHSFSGNISLTTDYIWRGISQTDEGPAIQGGLDYAHSSGLYAGAWASNVDFGPGSDANVEVDLYAGYELELAKDTSLNLKYNRFMYPGESSLDSGEFVASLSYQWLTLLYSYIPDMPDYTGDGEEDATHYVELAAQHDLPENFSIGGSFGWHEYSDLSETEQNWSLWMGYAWSGFDFKLAYMDTDIEDYPPADARAVFSVGHQFDF
jgi:uncharacterized protein (TIGR02001 family)